ncbi:MAG: IS200/IS605 family transposase [Planctomycetota bacterium]|jgi:putative transposase
MSENAYYEIYLHIVWRTKNNASLLRGQVEREVYAFLRQTIRDTDGVYLHDIGGTDDHIHMAVHIAPTVEIARWIGRLKGACSYHINNEVVKQKLLYWQNGYGVISFGKNNLDFVLEYVRNQRKNHTNGKVINRLERILG